MENEQLLKKVAKILKKERFMKPRDRIMFILKKLGNIPSPVLFMFVPEYKSVRVVKNIVQDFKLLQERRKICGY